MTTDTDPPPTPVRPDDPVPRAAVGLERAFVRARYAMLRTFRRDGTPVDCPVWFAPSEDGARLWFRSQRTGAKVRRLVSRPYVELRPCDWRGRMADPAPLAIGTARVLEDPVESAPAEAELHHRYGWQWNTMPLIRIPGTHTVDLGLGWADKVRVARGRVPLPGSVIVEVRLDAHPEVGQGRPT